MLAEDLAAPRKQRHTAKRICERLRAEHDARVSYSYVAKYVHRRRPQVVAQAAARDAARAGVVAGFVPQCHPPGAEAEVDFADLWVRLDGQMTIAGSPAPSAPPARRAPRRSVAAQTGSSRSIVGGRGGDASAGACRV